VVNQETGRKQARLAVLSFSDLVLPSRYRPRLDHPNLSALPTS
jgi:hypothetical protein